MPNPSKPLSLSAASGLALGLTAITTIVLGGAGYRLGWWHFLPGLAASEWATYASGLALVLSAVGLNQTRPGGTRRGLWQAAAGLLLALLPLGMAAQWEYATRTTPAINDISTDTRDAPVFWEMPTPTDYPGGKTAELQRTAYPDVLPLKLAAASDKVFEHALAVAKDKGWTVVASAPEEGRIEATASSLLYGFVDEVAIRIKPVDGGAVVDVRSRSRIGKVDRGVNARRIRGYLAALAKRSVSP